LVCNSAVSALIREGKTHQIMSQMQMGGKEGMKLLNDALAEHVQGGRVSPEEAYLKCVMKDDMVNRLEAMRKKVDFAAPAPPAAAAPAPSAPSRAAKPAAPASADPVPVGGAGKDDGYTDPFEAFRKKRGS